MYNAGWLQIAKMESTVFVPVNLSFSENLRCLKMPLLVGAISQKRWPSETCFVFAGQNVNSGKFKHLKYSENVKFTGTNYIDSILNQVFAWCMYVCTYSYIFIILVWSLMINFVLCNGWFNSWCSYLVHAIKSLEKLRKRISIVGRQRERTMSLIAHSVWFQACIC